MESDDQSTSTDLATCQRVVNSAAVNDCEERTNLLEHDNPDLPQTIEDDHDSDDSGKEGILCFQFVD